MEPKKVTIDGQTVHVEIKEGNKTRHEYWDLDQYNRNPNAIGRHPRYVCYTYPEKEYKKNYISMEDKFKEVFGHYPNIVGRSHITPYTLACPMQLGFQVEVCYGVCGICKENFWSSEYKEDANNDILHKSNMDISN